MKSRILLCLALAASAALLAGCGQYTNRYSDGDPYYKGIVRVNEVSNPGYWIPVDAEAVCLADRNQMLYRENGAYHVAAVYEPEPIQ